MPSRETATLLLLQQVVMRRLSEQHAQTRETAGVDFDTVGVRDIGMIGDEPIGAVQLNKGATTARITDAAALLDWVAEHLPEQIETIPATTRVRSACLTALLAEAKAKGVAVSKDGEPIPGIGVNSADPTLSVKPNEDAADVIARAFAEGRLTLGDLTAPIPIEA